MQKNMRIKIKSAVLLSASLLTLMFYQNCAKPISQSSSMASGLTELNIAEQKALTILRTKCATCHNSASPSAGVDVMSVDLLLATGAIVPTEPGLSPLFQAVSSGSMPPGRGLAQEDIMAISDWIIKMQKDQPVNLPPGSGPIPLGPTYASIYQNILKNACLGCHNSANQRGGVSFSTYASTMNTVQRTLPMNSGLYLSVAVNPTMPQGAPGSLTTAEKNAIFQWITNGAANN